MLSASFEILYHSLRLLLVLNVWRVTIVLPKEECGRLAAAFREGLGRLKLTLLVLLRLSLDRAEETTIWLNGHKLVDVRGRSDRFSLRQHLS